jgi:hypothetical protein
VVRLGEETATNLSNPSKNLPNVAPHLPLVFLSQNQYRDSFALGRTTLYLNTYYF